MAAGEKTPRVSKSVRFSETGIEAIEDIKERYGCDFSEAVRRILQVGYPRMPATWDEREF